MRLDVVQRRILDQPLELLGILRAAVVGDPGMTYSHSEKPAQTQNTRDLTNRELVEAQHVQHADLRANAAVEVGALRLKREHS